MGTGLLSQIRRRTCKSCIVLSVSHMQIFLQVDDFCIADICSVQEALEVVNSRLNGEGKQPTNLARYSKQSHGIKVMSNFQRSFRSCLWVSHVYIRWHVGRRWRSPTIFALSSSLRCASGSGGKSKGCGTAAWSTFSSSEGTRPLSES